MSARRLRFFPPTSAKKERDEELALFRELFKREREKNVNLLESVSTEFEPSVASFRSSSSSRPETPDPYPLSPPKSIITPITTPRFGSQRFARESNKETPVKPLQPGRFFRRKEERKSRPKSPGSLSVASTAASSRPETPDVNPKPPSIRRAANIVRGTEDPKPVERSIKRFSKDGPTKQKPDPKLQTRQVKSVVTKPRPASPSSRSVISATSSRVDAPYSEPVKSKGALKSLEKPVKKTINEAPAKQNTQSKPNSRTVSPLVRSRFPATLPDFSTEAPPNLITSVAPGRSTSATRSRPGVPATPSTEQRRSPSVTKDQRPGMEEKGNEKRGGHNSGVMIGSSMVEKMLNARKSTATGKVTARDEKTSKMRGMW